MREFSKAASSRRSCRCKERETWKHNPAFYTGQAASALFSLLARDYAPLRDRLKAAIARERQIPAMLESGRQNVTTVDATTAQLAKAEIAGSRDFFEHVVPAAFAGVRDGRLLAQLNETNRAVVDVLGAYQTAMENGPLAHPSGTYAIGAPMFARLLELQELTPLSLADYEKAGEGALAQTKAEFAATAHQIDPNKTPQVAPRISARVTRLLRSPQTASDDVVALRRFVVAHKIVSLPAEDDVKVVATPEFARETTFASMDAPGALEKVATQAFYNVTPPDPAWPAQRREQHLAFFNDYAFPIVSLHEVYPGHYANFVIDRHLRLSQIRRLISSGSFVEGWAHYDEQMMVDEGWGNGDPHVRLAQLQLALAARVPAAGWASRAHAGHDASTTGTRFFEENAFMGHEPSHREALRGTQDPLYGYYTLGKLEILKLRADYKAKFPRSFTLENFHDALLAHGDPPVAIVRRFLLGADDDGKLL